jgi:hypothetical protein
MPQGLQGSSAANASILVFGNEAHAKRGWLKNGNPPGDPSKAARCGAKTRRGTACRSPAMANGRCRMHGGCSTGPRTPEGLARSQRANWKNGRYSASAKAKRKAFREQWRWCREYIRMLSWVDKLWALLLEIADRLDKGESEGLRGECQRVSRLCAKYEAIMRAAPLFGSDSPKRCKEIQLSASVLSALLKMRAGSGEKQVTATDRTWT